MKEKSKLGIIIDTDNDGTITEQDISHSTLIQEVNEKSQKFKSQKNMAWFSLISIVVLSVLLFLPFIEIDRVQSIGEFIAMLYISLSGIVATYMGTTAWIYQKNKDKESV